MIEFKTYEESRLSDHLKLVLEVMEDWEWKAWYPNEDELKAVYSREGFTADTRHYVYDGDELVGFLSSAVEDLVEGVQFGSFHIPYIKKGYEHIEDKLMAKTIETLKAKGVQTIRASTMPGWGPMMQILEKLNFEQKTLLAYRTVFEVSEFDNSDYVKPDHIVEIDIQKEKELLIDTIQAARSISREESEKALNYYIDNNLFIAGTAVKTAKITTYGILSQGVRYQGDTIKRAFLSGIPVPLEGSDQLLPEIFKYLVHKAKKAGIHLIWHQIADIGLLEHYNELELKFEPFYQYFLNLD
ncbi:MAG: hypothetical protein ACXAD7_06130 [Candidatus Kariarchaeaceae archaeon]|jgi:hypothetical protein